MRPRPGLALVLAAVCARPSSAGDAKAPGELDYHTQLSGVHTTCPSAHFDPSFKPDVEKHSVTVGDVHATSITFWITLDREMYTEDGFPNVYIDRQKQEYDPLRDLNYTVMLNDTIDAVEKELKIKVQDPYQRPPGIHFTGVPETEYIFLILQAPEWDLVVQAQNIRVTNGWDHEIEAHTPGKFDRKSDTSVYFYDIDEAWCKPDSCMFYVQATCSDVATKVTVDQQERQNGEKVGFDMTKLAEKVVTIECIYDNEKWTQGETQQRYYSVVLQRDIEFKGNVMVSLLPHEGVCDQVLGDDGSAQSFDCRTNVELPMLIVHATLTHRGEQIFVKYSDDEHMVEVRSGLPMQLQGIGDVEVILEQGRDTVTYPVYLHTMGMCDGGMTCPKGMALKEPSGIIRDHFCKEDECDPAVDLPFCCADRASCENFDPDDCDMGYTVSELSVKESCKMTVCKPTDAHACCEKKQTCHSFDWELCPTDSYLRHDAKQVPCSKVECSADDIPICCVGVSQETCAWMPPEYCPKGSVVDRDEAWKHYCAGGTCSESDAATCCVELAKCSSYTCPHGLNPKNDSAGKDCRRSVCDEKDLGTCCEVGASCSTMTCSGNQVLSQSANTLWCSSDPCGEADAEKCCVDAASCDDLRSSCPSGKSLVYRSKEVLCVKADCSDDNDKETCCTYRDSCEHFPGTCPAGTKLWDGGLCEHESCTEHAADKSLCCLPDLGQEMEGLLLIQNAGFAKLGDTDNKGTVASVVSAAIAEHVGIDEDLIEIALSASLKGATNCDFMIELGDLNESVVADIRTKFKNKAPLMASINRKLANLEEVKMDTEGHIQVLFILVSDGMVDAAHGGVYIRGLVDHRDGDWWSVKLPGNLVEDGYPEEHLHNIEDDSDYIRVNVMVDALTRLMRVGQLIEQGNIEADLHDWVQIERLPNAPSPSAVDFLRMGGGPHGGPPVGLLVLIVLCSAALLGGVAFLVYSRIQKPDDEARGKLLPQS